MTVWSHILHMASVLMEMTNNAMEQHVDDVHFPDQETIRKIPTNMVYNKSINPQCQCHPDSVMKPRNIKPEQLQLTEESKLTFVHVGMLSSVVCPNWFQEYFTEQEQLLSLQMNIYICIIYKDKYQTKIHFIFT